MQRIAIIGIGCRFPGGADDAASYWALLQEGRCAISEIPADRWSLDGFHDQIPDLPGRSYARWGGFLRDIKSFDPAFFGLSPREATAMDPQQRLLLMTACEAAYDARLPLSALRTARTGVFIGVSTVDYGLLQRHRPLVGDIQAGTGTALSIVANRVSNRLDLSGPSMGIDTACSSALVALDTACRHLSDGTCGMAIAGGVNILLDPRMFMTFSRAHMLSPTGRIRAFDAKADGFVRGEGAGVVLLQPLQDALAAGHRIYAVIEATAVNQDGRTITLTEPSLPAQIAMMKRVAHEAGMAPHTLAYAEAHGTGTPVGDPIEAAAIGTVFGGIGRYGPLAIGSAKTNLGHLEPAAGIAGLIKAALVLHHGEIPPSLGFEAANPAIDFDRLCLTIPTRSLPLGRSGETRRALVNAFGFGGTNAAAILAEAPHAPPGRWTSAFPTVGSRRAVPDNDNPASSPVPVPLSGRTAAHLGANAAALVHAIDDRSTGTKDIAQLAAALAKHRDHDTYRAVILATSIAELRDRLICLAEDRDWPQSDRQSPPQIIKGRANPEPRIVFTFTGQGGQWWAMGRDLIEREPAFRQAIERFDAIFKVAGGWSVMEALLAGEHESRIHDAAVTPAVMFAFQYALAEVWRARGVIADIVLGHSFGEVTAAFVAGGIGMGEVARLVDQRGLIRYRVDRSGTMAAIGLGADAIATLLPDDGSIEIGGYNSPDMVTLTGEEAAIDRLIAHLAIDQPDVLARKLALDFAYHSSWFDPVERIFMEAVGALKTSLPALRVISTVTGELNSDFSTGYWWRNLRQPVLYQKAIERALDDGGTLFVELGPHRTLSSMTAATAAARRLEITTISSLDRRFGDRVALAVATGQLWVAGAAINWRAVLGAGETGTCDTGNVHLPRPPWLLQELWREPEEASRLLRPDGRHHPLLGRHTDDPALGWTSEISLASQPWLGDHRIAGTPVFPAAGYIEMLNAAGREVLATGSIELEGVSFPAALHIGSDDEIVLRTMWHADRKQLTIHSRTRDTGDPWVLRARATLFNLEGVPAHELPLAAAGSTTTSPSQFYARALARGYGWGRQFQGLRQISIEATGARGEVDTASFAPLPGGGYLIDPRALDSALQLIATSGAGDDLGLVLPSAIARIRIRGSLASPVTAFVRFVPGAGEGKVLADIAVADSNGVVLVEIDGLDARGRRGGNWNAAREAEGPCFLRETFEPLNLEAKAAGVSAGHWLIAACEGDAGAAVLTAELETLGSVVEFAPIACSEATGEPLAAALAKYGKSGMDFSVVYLASAAAGPSLADAAEVEALRVISFARSIAGLPGGQVPRRVVFLTRSVRDAVDGDNIDAGGLAQSVVLGAARTFALEVPGVRVCLVDADIAAFAEPRTLCAAISAPGTETEIVVRGSRCYAARLQREDVAALEPARFSISPSGPSDNFALRSTGSLGIDSLDWVTTRSRPPGRDDIEVEVTAAGLNFRDVMAVSGLLPDDAEPIPAIDALGLEFAGRVRRTGENAGGLMPGDRVFGMVAGALQRRLTLPGIAAHRIPDALSDAEAAGLASGYLTAWHALAGLAQLKAGETVLIHSASGGLGRAAIALAQHFDAHIIATAGTPEKRADLRSLGIDHVFNSRSLDFADGVMAATDGRGVDIILNSLSGAFIDKSLACLAPYGRFIELGKRDIHADSALGLRKLARNISFHAVDLARFIVDRPQQARTMMGQILGLLASGAIPPLPVSAYPAHCVGDAFRAFSGARHTGKIVVTLDGAQLRPRRSFSRNAGFDPDGSYLVTGGTSGFGLAIARRLARDGAGRVIAASRSGTFETTEAIPATIVPVRLDVTDKAAVHEAVADLARSPFPLRGVVHAAVAYDDALLNDMTRERIGRVLATKAGGGVNLTSAVEEHRCALDFFVSISSLAQVTGWPGQSNYAAANAFLEALAHHQRGRGIPGTCLNFGMLGETGHVARSAQMTSYLQSAGWIALGTEAALDMLMSALDTAAPALTLAAADWTRITAAHSSLAREPRLGRLLISGAQDGRAGGDRFDGLGGQPLRAAVRTLIEAETAKVLRVEPGTLAAAETLLEAGIDSLSSFELHSRIEQRLGLELPLAGYARATRFTDLAELAGGLIEAARSRRDG